MTMCILESNNFSARVGKFLLLKKMNFTLMEE